jgi:coproporphyrinogen III oxidase-like Fe-S oxidoreductase
VREARVGAPDDPALEAPPAALYVHVPFCVSLCPYCDFVVVAGAAARGPRNRLEAFAGALGTELALRADALDDRWGPPGSPGRPPVASLYLGGGTPSLLPPAALAGVVALARERYGLAADAEVTVEVNPGPDERGDAAALVLAGIGRLSVGAQSLDAGELRSIGRRHAPEDVVATVRAGRAAGIGSVSLDLLYDIPGQTEASFGATLDAALALEPDHLSLYALTLDDPDEEGLTGALGDHLPTASGARRWRAEARRRQDDDRAAAMYELAVERLGAAGFRGYEISNWARPGHESRHNLAYWRRVPHEAAGPGAHAFDGRLRRWNAARLDAWIAPLAAGHLPPGGADLPSPDAVAAERVILGLRLDAGIPGGWAALPPLAGHVDWARDAGLLEDAIGPDGDRRLRLTTRGRLLSNELFARLV